MELSLDELKLYLKPLVFFGELKLEISDYEEGKKIEVLDHDEGSLINLEGQTINENYACTTCNCTLYTDETNEVCFIEHSYGAITAANKEQVILLTKLIGATIKEGDKVEVTKAQARAIEEGKRFYLRMADNEPQRVNELTNGDKKEFARLQFVGKHFVIKIGDVKPWEELFAPLNEMSADELNRAILKGYIVKEGAE